MVLLLCFAAGEAQPGTPLSGTLLFVPSSNPLPRQNKFEAFLELKRAQRGRVLRVAAGLPGGELWNEAAPPQTRSKSCALAVASLFLGLKSFLPLPLAFQAFAAKCKQIAYLAQGVGRMRVSGALLPGLPPAGS